MDFFTDLLDSENRIFKWIAIDIIGNLTSVDFRNKFEEIYSKYFNFLSTEEIITIGHVIDNSGKIAKAKPLLSSKITNQLLKLENLTTTPTLSAECKNVLLGKTILAFSQYFTQIKNKRTVISFVKKQLSNPRNATKKKAERFLKKWNTLQMKNIEE